MSFTQRPLSTSADLTGKSFIALLEVLRSDTKQRDAMAELLAFQEEVQANVAAARKELEAVNTRSQELAQQEQEIKKQYAALGVVSASVKSGQVKFEEQRAKVEALFAAREAELDDREAVLAGAALAANDRQRKLDEFAVDIQETTKRLEDEFAETREKLSARESAVAAREAKAEELAKLLKDI